MKLLWYEDVLGGEGRYNCVAVKARGGELLWKRGGWSWREWFRGGFGGSPGPWLERQSCHGVGDDEW